ncbi:MAG: transcriptional regulator [Candidatus Paceibacterota bacterium]
MNVKLIKTEKDYKAALKRADSLWDSKLNSKDGDELEVLTTLIEKYEKDNFEIIAPDPIEAIKFRMEQLGMEKSDLAKIIGANRASEVLNKKRPLSLGIIRTLSSELKIPAASLIGN